MISSDKYPSTTSDQITKTRYYALITALIWIVLICGLLFAFKSGNQKAVHEIGHSMAHASLENDIIFWRWVARHGGGYVPKTVTTPAKPYLAQIQERDITTPSGKQPTLISPSCMTRQIFEQLQKQQAFPKGHITSLNPLRPENAPDQWEVHALKKLEQGATEVEESVVIDGQPFLRVMRLLTTEKPCLACHASQGNKEGDERGGISVTFPLTPIQTIMHGKMQQETIIHTIILLIGLGFIWFVARKTTQTMTLLHDERTRSDVKEEKLRVIFETSESGIILVSPHGIIDFANRRMAEMFGMTLESVIGSLYVNHLHPSEVKIADESMNQLIQGTVESVRVCRQYIRADGTDFWGHLSGKRLENTDGTLRALVGVISDITERKTAEESLSNSRAELKAIYEHAPVMMCLIDSSLRILYANPAFTDFTNVSEDVLRDVGSYEVFRCISNLHESPGVGSGANIHTCDLLTAINDTFKSGCVHQNIEYSTSIERNGSRHSHVLLGSTALINSTNKTLLLCLHDITDRKRTEEERQQLERQFHHAQKLESLGVLAGGIAHDFNNILTVILGHCHIANENLGSAKTSIKQIESAANRAADLCRQMLIYAGKSPLVQSSVNLWLLLDEVIKILQAGINKNVTIELNMKRIVPEITGDSGQLQQIIMNLIINAAEAIGDNNGTIYVALTRIVINTDQPEKDVFGTLIHNGNYICLEVSDTGCGMDEETQKRIFEPFYTTKFTGRGLGMSAIRGIVSAHGSMLQLSSTPGVGTTFKVYFPLPEVSGEVASDDSESPAFINTGRTILLVEDEQALLDIGTILLTSLGFNVLTAENGREAIEMYQERGCDISAVILDLVMPKMGGIDAYHELRKMAPALPIIICSGYDIESVENIINNDQYAEFEKKPYKPKQLRDVIMRMRA
ncbi:MAG: PAS domain S-box protein [Desulfuromonadaceae bacterium]|nr:PAS domain S-box protein [Desulfuromonadaceae bacterium]